MQGGSALTQQELLSGYTAEQLTDGKILLGGSSGGAMMLCAYGYSGINRRVLAGKGIVPLAVIPHANAWPIAAYTADLRKTTDLPICLVDEKQLAIFTL